MKREWVFGGHGVYTLAREDENKIIVDMKDYGEIGSWTHVFPSDFIRPLLDDPELFNAIMYPDFCRLREQEWFTIIKIVNMFLHRGNPKNLKCLISLRYQSVEWYYKEES